MLAQLGLQEGIERTGSTRVVGFGVYGLRNETVSLRRRVSKDR
jgi:hypothetical protein